MGDRRAWFLWAVALKIEIRATPIWTFEIFWKRVLLGVTVLTLAGYFTTATALHWWLGRQPHNQVAWTDVALAPFRWEQFRQKRGDTSIAQALEKLSEGDYVEAFHGLRVGLARSPGNFRGRLQLARLYAPQDPALAIRTLEAGLAHSASETEYLRGLFAFYTQFNIVTHAGEIVDDLLARPDVDPLNRSVLRAMQAGLVLASDPQKAARLLADVPPSGDAEEDARIARMNAATLVRIGRLDEAAAILARTRTVSSGIDQCRAEAELAVARGDAAELESVLRRLRLVRDIETPQAYLVGFNAWHRLQRLTLRDGIEREYYDTFGGHDAAMQLFAANAVSLDLPEVVHRAREVALGNRRSIFAYRVHHTELLLRRGDFTAAFATLAEWERTVETLPPGQRFYPELISRLARVTVPGGDKQLTPFLGHLGDMRGRASPAVYDLVLGVLERAGLEDGARQALELGLRIYPFTDSLLDRQRRYAAVVQAQPAVAATAPAADYLVPESSAEALAALDAALATGALAAVREQVRALRSARPDWLAEAESAVSLRELQLTLRTQDPFAARVAVRSYLDKFRGAADAVALVRLAGTLVTRGEMDSARMISAEVTAQRGMFVPVQEALAVLDLPEDFAAELQSAEAALAALDRLLGARDTLQALRLLDHVRTRAPEWLPAARNPLLVREVRLRFDLNQRPLALAAFKDLVVPGGVARAAAFRLVRDMVAAGETERALLLAREVVRLLPDDPAAARLQQEAAAGRAASPGS